MFVHDIDEDGYCMLIKYIIEFFIVSVMPNIEGEEKIIYLF